MHHTYEYDSRWTVPILTYVMRIHPRATNSFWSHLDNIASLDEGRELREVEGLSVSHSRRERLCLGLLILDSTDTRRSFVSRSCSTESIHHTHQDSNSVFRSQSVNDYEIYSAIIVILHTHVIPQYVLYDTWSIQTDICTSFA